MERHRPSAGANPARQLSFQPVAIGASVDEIATAAAQAVALAAAVEAAKATAADGSFDDIAHMVAPAVAATHDGTTVTLAVSEGGTPRGESARSGDFVEQDDGPTSEVEAKTRDPERSAIQWRASVTRRPAAQGRQK